ncbi:NTPase [Candidatus Chrysopegis kryptomonas]|nr:NTPase [Candidatus Chrysopegis kryptomonas]
MKKNLLITSPPGMGKTTAIKKFIELVKDKFKVSGFITEEIRNDRGERTGFKIITLDGKIGILADVNLRTDIKVGKYSVNLKDIEEIAVPSIDLNSDIIIIDEIGKMECFSKNFVDKVLSALDSPKTVVGTIKEKGDAITNLIKSRNDVEIIKLTIGNRDKIPAIIYDEIIKRFK